MRTITFGTFFMFMILASFTNISSAYAQTCNSDLKVSKNRDARSASENDATQFPLELTNNSSSSQSYRIEVINFNGTFTIDGQIPSRLSANDNLNVSILQNKAQNNTVYVPAGSTGTFLASVSVPPGTPVKHWGGLEVKAISDACPDGTVSVILKLFVTDSLEE